MAEKTGVSGTQTTGASAGWQSALPGGKQPASAEDAAGNIPVKMDAFRIKIIAVAPS